MILKPFFLLVILSLSFNECGPKKGPETKLAVWSVTKGDLVSQEVWNEEAIEIYSFGERKQKLLWEKAVSIYPVSLVEEYITKFEVMTDGVDESLAGVNPVDQSNRQWVLAVDFLDVTAKSIKSISIEDDVAHTLIHELGHIITLNNSQVEETDVRVQVGESRYLTIEGLAFEDSYINSFVQEFWNGEILQEWDIIQKIKSPYAKLDALEDFYNRYPNNFVTEYACESPEEDIAESWFEFVAGNEGKFLGKAKDKVEFFAQFPELVELKTDILSNF